MTNNKVGEANENLESVVGQEHNVTDFSNVIKNASKEGDFVWNDIEIHYKYNLNYDEFMKLVNLVSYGCFIGGKFRPEARDLLLRIVLVEGYTDVILPETNDERWAILFHTDLPNVVLDHIDKVEFERFEKIVKEIISNTLDHINSSSYALTQFIDKLQGELEETAKQFIDGGLLNQLITSEGTD